MRELSCSGLAHSNGVDCLKMRWIGQQSHMQRAWQVHTRYYVRSMLDVKNVWDVRSVLVYQDVRQHLPYMELQ